MRTAIEKRLDVLERQVAALRPAAPSDEPLAWARWSTDAELEFLEGVAERAAYGVEPSAAERLRWIEVEAGATRKMLAGEPDDLEKSRLEREVAASRWLR
jgi:hypothetical protein